MPADILLGLALLLALLSLRGSSARHAYAAQRLSERLLDSDCPPATVIVPVKGWDDGLAQNLASLASLDYPHYELIIAVRSRADLPDHAAPPSARIVEAGEGDPANGEKINNLLAAVTAASAHSEILAFADSDGRVQPRWLRALVAPLREYGVGMSTGYRWHAPDPPAGFWSLMRSVWNGVIAGGFRGADNGFAWGGAMAIRREVFQQIDVPGFWHGTVSDDFRISHAVRAAGLRIAFAPGAMVPSLDRTAAREFLGWIERQMIITRVYSPRIWWVGFIAHLIYCGAMLGALIAPSPARLAVLAVILGAGMWNGARRAQWARQCLGPAHAAWFDRYGWVHTGFVPLGTWVWLYSFFASARTTTIRWRGREYRLRRPAR